MLFILVLLNADQVNIARHWEYNMATHTLHSSFLLRQTQWCLLEDTDMLYSVSCPTEAVGYHHWFYPDPPR